MSSLIELSSIILWKFLLWQYIRSNWKWSTGMLLIQLESKVWTCRKKTRKLKTKIFYWLATTVMWNREALLQCMITNGLITLHYNVQQMLLLITFCFDSRLAPTLYFCSRLPANFVALSLRICSSKFCSLNVCSISDNNVLTFFLYIKCIPAVNS